ncbi:uncharacterized protein HHUB_2392 [Halobacterium hubeiense]|uniref:Uncharacterized protein n=1 Tax=Halobacterium hubeiense TaxID=1407499 RepID=A0A0U5H6L6_9EURY|nr:uncharacterized protein HHUB_2392 [Halobacterium hubeiense]
MTSVQSDTNCENRKRFGGWDRTFERRGLREPRLSRGRSESVD